MKDDFEIREMSLSDIEETAGLEESIFSSPWSKKSLKDTVSVSENVSLVIREKEKNILAGYCIFTTSFEDVDLCRIAVAEGYRRKHLADRLMEYAFGVLKNKNINRILLEVRQSNVSAIALYKKYGFEQIGVRKKYYSEPVEDGLVYELILNGHQ